VQQLVQVVQVVGEPTLIRVQTGRRLKGTYLRRCRLAAVACEDEVEWIAGHEPRQEEVDGDGDPRGQQIETDAAEQEGRGGSMFGTGRHWDRGSLRSGTRRHIHMPSLASFGTAYLITRLATRPVVSEHGNAGVYSCQQPV
jgi:hypothetical protein